MRTIYDQIKRFVQTGACIYKDNWCDGGSIKNEPANAKEPCRYYDGKRCTHPGNPKNVVVARKIRGKEIE